MMHEGAYCSCDAACVAYKDCCPDFRAACLEQFERGQIAEQLLDEPSSSVCHGIMLNDGTDNAYYHFQFIDSCRNGSGCPMMLNDQTILDIELGVPVRDPSTEIYYINMACARCNGVDGVDPLQVGLECPNQEPRPDTDRVMSVESLPQQVEHCTQFYYTNATLPRRCSSRVIAECQQCDNQDLIKLCVNSSQSYTNHFGQNYRNIYCAVCNDVVPVDVDCLRLMDFNLVMGPQPFSIWFRIEFLNDGLMYQSATIRCHDQAAHLPVGINCNDTICPVGYNSSDGTCVPTTYYCDPVTPIEDLQIEECSTCANRCGDINRMETGKLCSCDSGCILHKDCCPDFTDLCAEISHEDDYGHHEVVGETRTMCEHLATRIGNEIKYHEYQFICSCLNGSDCPYEFSHRGLDLEFGVPVRDKVTNLYYVNIACARCNNVRYMEAMQPMLACPTLDTPSMAATFENVNSVLSATGDCNVIFASATHPRRCLSRVIDQCSPCENQWLVDMCANSGQSYASYMSQTYRNIYCAACNYVPIQDTECSTHGWPDTALPLISFMLKVSVSDNIVLVVESIICNEEHPDLVNVGACRTVICPEGYRDNGGACQPVVDYCDASAFLEGLEFLECSSCFGRCGDVNNMVPRALCSCDKGCLLYKDCCPDFQRECTEQYGESLDLVGDRDRVPGAQCQSLNAFINNEYATRYYLFITHCTDGSECLYSSNDELNLEFGLPVRDAETGLYFVSLACARCNDIKDIQYLPSGLSCSDDLNQMEFNVWGVEELLSSVKQCFVYSAFPKNHPPRRCNPSVIDKCSNCENNIIVDRCENSSFVSYTAETRVYRNMYCVVCNHVVNDIDCGRNPVNEGHLLAGSFDLSLVIDFTSSGGAEVDSVRVTCDNTEVEMPIGITCDGTICPLGHEELNGNCLRKACEIVTIPSTDFSVVNNTLTITKSGEIYYESDFVLRNTSALVCRPLSSGLGITTIVFSMLSLICLVIRVGIQPFYARYNSVSGRLQCNLAAALALATLMLLISPLAARVPTLCAILAAIKAFGYLASHCWMNCVAFDTWRVVYNSMLSIQENPNRSIIHYVLLGWITPAVLACLWYSLDFFTIPGKYRPNFGGHSCWFQKTMSLILYIFLPIAVSVFINIILFVLTSVALSQSFKLSNTMRKASKAREYKAYLKLFILIGITWSVSLIAVWIDSPVVWYAFVVLNASQGIFLFVAFVVDTDQCFRWARRCCPSRFSEPSQTSRSTTLRDTNTTKESRVSS